MANNVHTCRFCKVYGGPMGHYAVRHWSHPECGIKRFGASEFFSKLHAWQVNSFPWLLVKQYKAEIAAAFPEITKFADGI